MFKITVARAKKVLHLADGNNFYISDGANYYGVYSQDFTNVQFNSKTVKMWLKTIHAVDASPKYYVDDTLNMLSGNF